MSEYRNLMQRAWLCLLATLAGLQLSGCAAVGRLPQLEEGYYQLIETNDDSLARAVSMMLSRQFYVEQIEDSLVLWQPNVAAEPLLRYGLRPGRHVVLLHREFDFDIFTLPFKIRPPRENQPIQLNTTFNAALYFGRRLDFYHLNRHRLPSGRAPRLIRTTGFGYGVFTGLGSSLITPDVTRQQAASDYEGLVLHAGLAAIYDARIFNVGVAVGADQLLGPDADNWVYRRRPWLGFLFGLNLN